MRLAAMKTAKAAANFDRPLRHPDANDTGRNVLGGTLCAGN
jgi:hypothetical protein